VVILTARAWLAVVAGTFLGGLLAIWAGLWVEGDVPRRATAGGLVILRGALLLLLVAVNLSDTYDNPAFAFNLVLGAMD
jgi:ABC-type xylose transport system permease subunit